MNWKPADIVGSGPFRMKDYKPAQYILLERNPYFCEVDRNGQRLPYFDNIIYTVVPDMNAMSLRFLSGESDADDFILPLRIRSFQGRGGQGKIQTARTGHRAGDRIFLVQRKHQRGQKGQPYVDPEKLKWFRNAKFRQACSYAIDRESIIKSVYSGPRDPELRFRHARQQKMV